LLAPFGAFAQTAPSGSSSLAGADAAQAQASESIIVTGTRQQGRTLQSSPAPVDVISAKELQSTGQQNVFDALNKVLPSLDLPPFGFDTAGLVRSARLRSLSPDDTLVLVDGKRRHVSANINADIGPAGGSDPVDLDMIPISLIDHIEVLRDGAAAQYGSDAIAGVINIILKHDKQGGDAFAQEGATYAQDGFTNNIGANWAAPILNDGFFDVAADYRYHDHTDRSGNFIPQPSGLTATGPAGAIPIAKNTSEIEGDPRYNLVNIGYNAGYNLGPAAELYSFATWSYRHAESFENFRNPNYAGAYSTGLQPGAPFQNLTAAVLYPNGFQPLEALNEDDYSFTAGIKGDVWQDLHWDLSTTVGGDIDNLSTLASLNPFYLEQYGSSPTHFHAGEFNNNEWTTNLDLSKPVETGIFAEPLNIAIGGEFRRDSYQIQHGDYPAYFSGGAQAYPGFPPAAAGYFQRENEAVYGDLATSPIEHWQVDLAGRFEHYSDVGNTETGKFTTRYDFSKLLGIRGTISNGFRAPTLAQEGFAAVNVAPTNATGQFPVDSAAARSLGAVPLKAERSQNYEVGFISEPIDRLHAALDFYMIDIRDQIVDSGLIGGTPASEAAVNNAFLLYGLSPPAGAAGSLFAQFFTNGVNTRTQGADITLDYTYDFSDISKIVWLLAGNFNSTQLTRINPQAQLTPDVLSEIKEDTPKSKVLLQGTYTYGPWSVLARETRYGQVIQIVADGYTGGAPFVANRNRPEFITDLELGYKFTPDIQLVLGADNLFDKYANHTSAFIRYQNAEQYILSSPYGIDGGFYYARLNFSWGKHKAAPPPPPEAAPPPPPAPIPVRTYLVFFDWDRADLTPRARQIVLTAAQASTHVQTTQIEVDGYTDLSGTAQYNQRLSVRRAETVRAELVKDGVAASEIDIHGYGETHPLVPTAPGVREPQNRRVEIILK
jgi:iron complex outermembrane receptor protein